MNVHNNGTRVARLSALALVAAIAGCGGGTSTVTPSGQGVSAASSGVSRDSNPLCNAVSITQGFNGTAIAAGDWIWFSSVFHPNNFIGKFRMAGSNITINSATFRTPGSRISIHAQQVLHFNWSGGVGKPNGIWWLMAPENTSGNDFLNGFAWQVPPGGLAGGATVTWSGKFLSKTPHQIQWQWGAAVYTQMPAGFPPDYNTLGVKPLDDNHWPPMNSDHAGTPEAIKSFLTAGATGGGGSNYTGGLSSTLAVTPCQS